MTACYDLVVLGAGSAGLSLALRAAEHGARVAICDPGRLGGTCVNVGCVPKKAFWYAAQWAQSQAFARTCGFRPAPEAALDWRLFRARREAYIAGIRSRYAERLRAAGITLIGAHARLLASDLVETATGARLGAPRVAIATGARPLRPDLPGAELGMVSDDIFALERPPGRIAVVGGGYVAAECASLLQALGGEVELLVRGRLLAGFDEELVGHLAQAMQARGLRIRRQVEVRRVYRDGAVYLEEASGARLGPYDALLWAVGRVPNSDLPGLDRLGIALDERRRIRVDRYQETAVAGVCALGDVSDNRALTPVAIAAGHALAERWFGGRPDAHLEQEFVPSVAFTDPPLGGVGLDETQARARYGEAVQAHVHAFVPMSQALADGEERSWVKMLCVGQEERVVGLHAFGPGVDEYLQGFAVAMRQGLTRRDLRAATAIHPTAAEELLLH